mmetsp:Transcript_29627/g.85087  ORF Transcript_29627/g.85087 Transcript_29627/m.85087 type:complete len:362 (+) Transcript_29627:77-1162(+)
MVVLPIARRSSEQGPSSKSKGDQSSVYSCTSSTASTTSSDGFAMMVKNTFVEIGSDELEGWTGCGVHRRGSYSCAARFSDTAPVFQEEDRSDGEASGPQAASFEQTPPPSPQQRCTTTPCCAVASLWADTPQWAPTPRWANLPTSAAAFDAPPVPPELPAKAASAPDVFSQPPADASAQQIMLPIPWTTLRRSLPGVLAKLDPSSLRVVGTGVYEEDGRVMLDLKLAFSPGASPSPVVASRPERRVASNPDLGSCGRASSTATVFGSAPAVASCEASAAQWANRSAGLVAPGNAGASGAQRSQQVCCHWKNKGWCRYQSACKFMHPEHKRGAGMVPDTHGGKNGKTGPSKQAAEATVRFGG